MLPIAKTLVVTVLLGGGAVGTYALAGGKFGPGGRGETTLTSAPETTKPTVAEVKENAGDALAPSASSTPDNTSARVASGPISKDTPESQGVNEGVSSVQSDAITPKIPEVESEPEIQSGARSEDAGQGKAHEPGAASDLPAVPEKEEQKSLGTENPSSPDVATDKQNKQLNQDQPVAQSEQENAQAKTTKENESQGNSGKEGNKEQVTASGSKSQDSATNGSDTDTALKDRGVNGGEETRTASGGETAPQEQGPSTDTN